MRRSSFGILQFLCVMLLAVSCGPRVIPADKLSLIYKDMFLADQWIQEHPELRKTADTSLVYEPIFRKYGYRFADYDATVKYYLTDYDTFIRIIRAAADMLKSEADQYQAIQDWVDQHPEISVNYLPKDFERDTLIWKDTTTLWPVPVKQEQVDEVVDTMTTQYLSPVDPKLRALDTLNIQLIKDREVRK